MNKLSKQTFLRKILCNKKLKCLSQYRVSDHLCRFILHLQLNVQKSCREPHDIIEFDSSHILLFFVQNFEMLTAALPFLIHFFYSSFWFYSHSILKNQYVLALYFFCLLAIISKNSPNSQNRKF